MKFLVAHCLFLLQTACVSANQQYAWINENPSFEQSVTGNPNDPGGAKWNFRDVDKGNILQPVSVAPIRFLRDSSRQVTRQGTGYCLMTLWEGAIFPPASIRMGQSVRLKKNYLYSVVVWARVNRGTTIFGQEGAVVSTFCEARSGQGFIGKDSTLNAVNSLAKADYSRIQFDIVGDGKIWDCYIGLLGQPTSDIPAREVEMYVDDFRIWEKIRLSSPQNSGNALLDGNFNQPLSMIEYQGNGPEFNGPTPWHFDYNRFFPGSSIPYVEENVLYMALADDRNIGEFLGVFQRVYLQQGQKYQLSIDYTRLEPSTLPPNVNVSIFNYYVRLPDATIGGPNQPHIRATEGLLLGEVDVRLERGDDPSNTASVTFVAPRSATYEVVLKMSAYGNPKLDAYEMSFENARLTPINN